MTKDQETFEISRSDTAGQTTINDPLTDAEARMYQQGMERFAQVVTSADLLLIQRYLKNARPQIVGGEHYAGIAKVLSVSQLVTAQRNLGFFIQMGEQVLKAREVVLKYQTQLQESKNGTPEDSKI